VIIVQAAKGKFVFRLGDGEKSLLVTILELYPRVTSAAQLCQQSENHQPEKETQALLEEALAEQRAENKKNLKAFLADPKRFQKQEDTWRFFLTASEADWLLQILNDIRVGSWIVLGSPENHLAILGKKNARDYWAMEISGRFQAVLLEAISKGRHK
jgi:hypothetical protein